MDIPSTLKYTESHEWLSQSNETVTVGITAFAVESLGDLVYFEPPTIGKTYKRGEVCGVVESVKAAADIYAPLTGSITEVNTALADAPQKVNEEPYGAGWLFKMKLADTAELATLLDNAAYAKIAVE